MKARIKQFIQTIFFKQKDNSKLKEVEFLKREKQKELDFLIDLEKRLNK